MVADHGMSFLPCCFKSSWIYVLSFIVIAYSLSSTFRFYIKSACLWFYYLFVGFVFVLAISIWTPASKNNPHKICKRIKWIDGIWGIQYNVKGLENYKKDSNYIIVANHQSSFDMNVVVNFMPPKTTVMVKKDVIFIPCIGFLFWISGVLFINRGNREKAINTMKEVAEQLKKEKFNVWIFPEGTRHMGSKLLPFKKGAFHLAQQAQMPILPVVISNYENIINFNKNQFKKGTIDITILPEVSTEGLETSDVEHLTQNVHSMMCKEYGRNTPGQAVE